jgi:DNA-binding MarR family transcriptional regulator
MISPRPDNLDWSKSFMYSLHETYFLVEKRLESRLAHEGDITFSQFLVLLPLQCNSGASQSDVAEFLHLTEATVSRHIATLDKEGLLERHEEEGNRRKHILSLTQKGAAAFKRAHAAIEAELKDIFSVVPVKDRERITENFDRVLAKLV